MTPEVWAAEIGTDNSTSIHAGAPLNAYAIFRTAQVMLANNIQTADDLRHVAYDLPTIKPVEKDWRAVPGQGPGVSWHCIQKLAGIPEIKPDRVIIRFVADPLGLPRKKVGSDFARDALLAAAE